MLGALAASLGGLTYVRSPGRFIWGGFRQFSGSHRLRIKDFEEFCPWEGPGIYISFREISMIRVLRMEARRLHSRWVPAFFRLKWAQD